MRTSESLLSLIALALGLCLSLACIFANFVLVLTLKFIQTGDIQPATYLIMVMITISAAGLPLWLFQRRRHAQISDTVSASRANASAYQERQRHITTILELSQQQDTFTAQEVQQTTGLDRIATEYLLEDCISAGHIKIDQYNDNVTYSRTHTR